MADGIVNKILNLLLFIALSAAAFWGLGKIVTEIAGFDPVYGLATSFLALGVILYTAKNMHKGDEDFVTILVKLAFVTGGVLLLSVWLTWEWLQFGMDTSGLSQIFILVAAVLVGGIIQSNVFKRPAVV